MSLPEFNYGVLDYTPSPSSSSIYFPGVPAFYILLGSFRNQGPNQIPPGAAVLYPVPKMPWVRHASWQKFSTVTDTSFIKWKWYLQGRAKPDLKAFSRLLKDVASNMLSPLPENLVELVAVPPLPHPLATWEVPWDQLSDGQGVAILHQWQCHHCKGCSSREGHGILPGLRHVSIEQGTPSSA